MDTFRRASLITLADYLNGYAFKPEDHSEEGLPIIRIEQLKDPDADFDYYDGVVPSENHIEDGDLIFSWSASLSLQIWNRGRAILNQHLFKVIPKPDVDKLFLKYCIEFNLPELTKSSHGSTMKHITRRELANFHVTIPTNKRTQVQIAEVLSTLDRAIEQTEALIAKYQRIKTGLMHYLLTRGIDEKGNLRDPATHKFKPSSLGSIPEEWEIYKLSQLTKKIIDGTHHTPQYVEHGVPFVTVKNLTAGSGIDLSDVNYITQSDHKRLYRRADPKPGDILVTKDGTLGVARIAPFTLPEFSIFVSVAQLRPNPDLCISELIWAFFESGSFESQLGQLSAGTGLRHIHLEHFREFLVATPPKPEQKLIFQILHQYENLLKAEQDSYEKYQRLKAGLMQDLLTGKVSVLPLLGV